MEPAQNEPALGSTSVYTAVCPSVSRRRDGFGRQRRSGPEEESLHLLDKELLRLGRPGLQAVFIQQHLLVLSPLVPSGLGYVLINLLPKLGIERRLVQSFHFALVAHAKYRVCHCELLPIPLY